MADREAPLNISAGDIRLDGRLAVHKDARGCALVTHPHPLFGGDMDSPVVRMVQEACFETGFTTLRFNFRGVGKSTGRFDDGAGEQEDVRACLEMLETRFGLPLILAGYSFGSWVNAHLLDSGQRVYGHIMVSPPVAFMSFADVFRLSHTSLIITGGADDIAPPDQVRALMDRCGVDSRLEILPSGDHFYNAGSLQDLKEILLDHLGRLPLPA